MPGPRQPGLALMKRSCVCLNDHTFQHASRASIKGQIPFGRNPFLPHVPTVAFFQSQLVDIGASVTWICSKSKTVQKPGSLCTAVCYSVHISTDALSSFILIPPFMKLTETYLKSSTRGRIPKLDWGIHLFSHENIWSADPAWTKVVQVATLRSLFDLIRYVLAWQQFIPNSPLWRTPLQHAQSNGYQLYTCLLNSNEMHSTFNKTLLMYVLCYLFLFLTHCC